MKPDWEDAPDWARFLAMDEDGDWYWYELKPREGNRAWISMAGRAEFADCSGETWSISLEGRP